MKFLLNVGAEKAGTTWLYNYFQTHPEFYDNGKELNVIQRDNLVPTHFMRADYKSNLNEYFDDISKINKVTGDFTHYEGSTENLFRLFNEALDVVPVYIMRDPIKRAWSAWNMLGGGADFDMPAPAFFVTHNYLQCKYKETVEALDNVFHNPLYFFYEDFFKQENLNHICKELKIFEHPGEFTKIHNQGNYVKDGIPKKFIDKFVNKEIINFIFDRFNTVPWNLNDYQ
jgi:hypothetical protein